MGLAQARRKVGDAPPRLQERDAKKRRTGGLDKALISMAQQYSLGLFVNVVISITYNSILFLYVLTVNSFYW